MVKKPDRIIIDTNLWISFILTNDYSRLDKLLDKKQIIILFSEELLNEFIDVATRPKFSKYFSSEDLQTLLNVIITRSTFIEIKSEVKICRDLKDNFLLSLAKDGKATHLLTGDKDLLHIKKFEKTFIQTLTDYLRLSYKP